MGADVPPEISVSRTDVEPNLTRFLVVVSDADGTTSEHVVTLSSADRERLATGHPNPGAFVHACFEFLLERERKESILRHVRHQPDRDLLPRVRPSDRSLTDRPARYSAPTRSSTRSSWGANWSRIRRDHR